MADIAAALPPHAPWTDPTRAIICHLNNEIAKERVLGPNNGGRNREVDCPGSESQWREITAGWNDSSTAAIVALQGVEPRVQRRSSKKRSYSESSGDIVSAIVLSAVIYLGNPLLYFILQLEAFKESCAGPAKELDSKDFLVVHRLECIYTKKPTFSPDFFVEQIRFKVSFLTLHTTTPSGAGQYAPIPSFTFPVYRRSIDEARELPANKKEAIRISALTIPRWAHLRQLCSRKIHPNLR